MNRNNNYAIRYGLILVLSISLVVLVTWFAPSLDAAVMNMLFRLRGRLDLPRDVVVLAIDDASLQRIGKWPWPRSQMADVIDRLSQARVRSIGLDVVYAEAGNPDDDHRLAAAISRNGRVILPAQLYQNNSSAPAIVWLKPIPEFANAARALGHAHIAPDVNGMARNLQLRKADDRGEALWAFAAEIIRAAERISETEIEELDGSLLFGRYSIPVLDGPPASAPAGVTIIRPNEMIINFAGPARSFPQYSIADLVEGKLQPVDLEGRIVLIGAVAASMGDSRVVPFMHYGGRDRVGQEGGEEMPGIEIHANIIHTIRGSLGLQRPPEWIAFLSAIIVILCSALTIRWLDGWRQMVVLFMILLAICLGSFYAFRQLLIVPPFLPMMTGFLAVIPLLFNRQLNVSRQLDLKLKALSASQEGFLSPEERGLSLRNDDPMLLDLPKSLAWKLRTVDDLTTRLLARMSFIRRILTSMGEGVLVADLKGRIIYANDEALKLFGLGESELIGTYFAEFLIERGKIDGQVLKEAVSEAFGGQNRQLEFEIASPAPRYYSLLLSALTHEIEAKTGHSSRTGFSLDLRLPSLEPIGTGAIGVVALISDITKRVELDRVKTETLQLVSHELRTPLTSIRGLSDVLLKFPVGAEESREMLITIHSEALRLGETINRYLDLTRLESGGHTLHLAEISCPTLIADSIRNLSVFAAERRIVLTPEVDQHLPPLQADEQLLMQAIGNLLSNAIKYSPPGTEVIVRAEQHSSSVLIRVCDEGYGIPPEAREKIFQKFFRLDRPAESQVVGTGLGLPLVKEIVEQHGGRISVAGEPGQGSIFTIALPLSPAVQAHHIFSR